ncbi:enoyl-CoA hydratase/isomerase family protein [Bradyrhizobium manausense]
MRVEQKDGVAWMMLSRPEKLNCLALRDYLELGDAVLQASADPAIDVIVIGATGRAFCTGGDLKEILAEIEKGPAAAIEIVHKFADASIRLFQLMESSAKTVVAMVNGPCHAGGLCMLLSCDVSVVSDRSNFAVPEGRVGLADPFVPLRLARMVGVARAKWMMFSGEILDAGDALRAGLVTHVVPHDELEGATRKIVSQIQEMSPASRALYKKSINSDLAPFDRSIQFSANAGPDAAEGLSAFVQKRKPIWPSRAQEQ